MKVKDVMTREPVTIDPEAPLGTAMDVMRRKRIRHLPVVDDAGRLVGIITDRDLRQETFAPVLAEHLSLGAQRRLRGLRQELGDLRVKHAMTWVVVTTEPEAAMTRAAVVMFERRIGSLPVVEDGKLVGILTERDLLRALAKEFPDTSMDRRGFIW